MNRPLDQIIHALQPLVAIAEAYDANELDDEARKRWGRNYEHENTTPPEDIILYTGRGGKTLLTLADCLNARRVLGVPLAPRAAGEGKETQ